MTAATRTAAARLAVEARYVRLSTAVFAELNAADRQWWTVEAARRGRRAVNGLETWYPALSTQ